MIISANVDLEQFKEDGQWTLGSSERLKGYADSYFTAMAEVRPALFAGICAMKGRLNEKISERNQTAYDDIIKLTRGEEYENLALYDYELKIFKTAVKIYELEKNANTCIFDSIEYTEHFEAICRQLTFYFRRMQLGLAKPLQEETMKFIAERKLSVYAVTQIVLDSVIGEKNRILTMLAALYEERLAYGEALYMLAYVLEQNVLPDEKQKELEEKREEIELKYRMAKGV